MEKLRAFSYLAPADLWGIKAPRNKTIAQMTDSGEKGEEYARRLVKAWNEYDELKATNDELVGLLNEAKCPNACINGSIPHKTRGGWEQEQCQWCYLKEQALAKAERSKE